MNVINVFGSWIGDFVSPGHSKEEEALADSSSNDPGAGGASFASGDQGGDSAGNNNPGNEGGSDNSAGIVANEASIPTSPTPTFENSNLLASATLIGGTGDGGVAVAGAFTNQSDSSKKVIDINLAWLIVLAPGYLAIRLLRKRFIGI